MLAPKTSFVNILEQSARRLATATPRARRLKMSLWREGAGKR